MLQRHCSVDGIVFPFSRGVSFYTVEDGKIKFGRDIVEPTIKPGHNAIKVNSYLEHCAQVMYRYSPDFPSKLY